MEPALRRLKWYVSTPLNKFYQLLIFHLQAAIAACVLGDPKNADRLAYGDNGLKDGKTVGTRVREMIQELGFPRVSPEQTKRLSREYSDKGVDPSVVNVAYNGYKEDQLAPHTL